MNVQYVNPLIRASINGHLNKLCLVNSKSFDIYYSTDTTQSLLTLTGTNNYNTYFHYWFIYCLFFIVYKT